MARGSKPPEDAGTPLKRRDFLKAAGLGAGALVTGAAAPPTPAAASPRGRRTFPSVTPPSTSVVVVGAGAFGGWTAHYLRKQGVAVTVVDAYGPSNSRATSGDESRGVRSSYGDRAAPVGELWSAWARKAMHRWTAWDLEWGHDLKTRVFYKTGDLFLRSDWEPTIKRTREIWEKAKVPFEVLAPEECRYRWPQINIDGITAILHEPDAGVVRARRAMQAVASVNTRELGIKQVIARMRPGEIVDGKMQDIHLINGDKLQADAFVFACGPWLPKVFPELLGNRMRIPLGQVVYYGTPLDSNRFTFPSMPSYNFPGVTGWVAIPEDSRGFRVRGTESAPRPAPAAGADTSAAGRGRGAGRGAAAGAAVDTAAARRLGLPTAPAAARSANDTAGRNGQRGATPPAGAAGAAAGGAAANGRGQGAGGNAPAADPRQSDPDLSVRWFDINANTRQRDFVAHRFPEMKDAPVLETRCCHYDQTSSRNFIIDRIPGASNAWIAGGGNSEAFKSGPVIGEYVAQRVLGIHTDPEIDKQFVIPKDEFQPGDTSGFGGGGRGRGGAADTTAAGRGGRAGGRGTAADSGRGGRGTAADSGRGGRGGARIGVDSGRGGRGGGGGGGK